MKRLARTRRRQGEEEPIQKRRRRALRERYAHLRIHPSHDGSEGPPLPAENCSNLLPLVRDLDGWHDHDDSYSETSPHDSCLCHAPPPDKKKGRPSRLYWWDAEASHFLFLPDLQLLLPLLGVVTHSCGKKEKRREKRGFVKGNPG